MKPDGYEEQSFAACCGKCRHAGSQANVFMNLMCYHGDSEDAVNESLFLEGDGLDEWWTRRIVCDDGICPRFRAGDPQEVSWSNEWKKPEEG